MSTSVNNMLLFLLLIVSMIVVAGCQESAQPEPVITLKLWGGTPENVGPKEVVDNWNQLNPHIQVEYQFFENTKDGNAKLEMAIFSGREVDVVIGYHPEILMNRIDANLFEPLDEHLQQEEFDLTANFGEISVEAFNGKHYYIPANQATAGILVNKTALDEIGEPLPNESWTWDEFAEIARKLTINKDGKLRYGINNGILADIVNSYFGKNPFVDDQGKITFSRSIWEKILNIVYRMHNVDYSIYPDDDLYRKYTPEQLFTGGHITMLSETFRVRAIKDVEQYAHNFVTAVVPRPSLFAGEKPYSSYGMMDYVSISSTSQHKEAAWEFLQWYVTEGFAPMMKYGRVPTWLEVSTDEYMEEFFKGSESLFDLPSFENFFNGQFAYDFPQFNTSTDEYMSIVEEEGHKFFQGIQSLEHTLDNLEVRAKVLYKELNIP